MEENYIYPVILKREDSEILVSFPDFPGQVTCAETEEEAIKAAQEILSICIRDIEDRGGECPLPSKYQDIKLEDDDKLVYIHMWMPYFRHIEKIIYVKKTLTVPKWLDEMAKKKNINFSAVLVKGLKNELGIGER
ncbi:type II toxin-antitoxin system HicB family antitoxin [Lachnoanaerobaculum gingivalis]|uniref:Type II toxin-antitoxin system HicB family antitoxin n=1 Tax=Lachnoanaerobaculum gingivalis TaxID=2490855 RepID=A0A3P3QW05_9FIRM|nr:type II toxin-antitoxin system HicB family antitoxin [Lachnoanaerobaculum gingivalis]RRJ24520.1 type II toxin-antitoxin system HicB family antitoxin [Lachnoanaerobaculum gingivalis]